MAGVVRRLWRLGTAVRGEAAGERESEPPGVPPGEGLGGGERRRFGAIVHVNQNQNHKHKKSGLQAGVSVQICGWSPTAESTAAGCWCW